MAGEILADTRTGKNGRAALERDVCAKWEGFAAGGSMSFQVGMTTAIGIN
jgi:hypothetical protein